MQTAPSSFMVLPPEDRDERRIRTPLAPALLHSPRIIPEPCRSRTSGLAKSKGPQRGPFYLCKCLVLPASLYRIAASFQARADRPHIVRIHLSAGIRRIVTGLAHRPTVAFAAIAVLLVGVLPLAGVNEQLVAAAL